MRVTMVIICSKTLEKKKAVDDVTPWESDSELQRPQTMSKGTTLFSCGTVEADRWRGLGRSCVAQRDPTAGPTLESLWDVLPERGGVWGAREAGAASAITSLIRDLSLSEGSKAGPPRPRCPRPGPPSASAARCPSPTGSEEEGEGEGGRRSPWRPAGSRVWACVEKRRCHSGAVCRGAGAGAGGGATGVAGGSPSSPSYPAMQRSSSFSLPARSNGPPPPPALELPRFPSAGPDAPQPHPRPLLSPCPSPCPRSTSPPPAARRTPPPSWAAGRVRGLARSQSQPCALNDKKIGMKRRRPEDVLENRPSLDLAKMTQKLRNFQSLSCPGFTGAGSCQSSHAPPTYGSDGQCEPDHVWPCDLGAGLEPRSEESREDSAYEELDSEDFEAGPANGEEDEEEEEEEEGGAPWGKKDVYQLGGELDIEQIERN
ncbi:hypothetical protein AAFF_G00085880 [Aldrovandia affinis]|uniref:Protein FAM53B n=1 Tax=Aldrovandia affinis TaxID=143900 RepID=A0AAD7RWR3_9TELE|nr:hypothetical protein AAFF_G00085880 [Aldrovandia affinis]